MAYQIGQLKTWDASATDGLNCKGYSGIGSDGEYLYYSPFHNGSAYHGVILRQKINSIFQLAATWEAFDAGSIDGLTCKGFYGNPIFDGRFMYFVPYNNGAVSGVVLRFDTIKPFKSADSWDAYDAGSTDGLICKGFNGAVFDGCQFIFFIPFNNGAYNGIVLKYDTTRPFKSAESWSAYNTCDFITLKTASGYHISPASGGGGAVVATQKLIGDGETFTETDLGGGKVSLRATDNKYLSATDGGQKGITADSNSVGNYESFTKAVISGFIISLRTYNNHYLVADGNGGKGLYADQHTVGDPEKFTRIDLGSGKIALLAFDGVHYVCAINGGGSKVTVNQYELDDWRVWRLCNLGGGYASLKTPNGHFLSATGGGGSTVVATSTSVGANERFLVTDLGSGNVSLKTADGVHYLSATSGGGSTVVATGTSVGANETFALTKITHGGFSGAVIVGNFLYLSPIYNGVVHGKLLRYNLSMPFKSISSWSEYDICTLNPYCKGFGAPCTDGRYIYFPNRLLSYAYSSNVDNRHLYIVRYDTTLPFTDPASYNIYNILDLCDDEYEYHSECCIQGQYVVFTPSRNTILVYDSEKPFSDPGSWTQKDCSMVDGLNVWGQLGIHSDPNYVYFAPYASHAHGVVLRSRVNPCPSQIFPSPGEEDLGEYIIDDYDGDGFLSVTSSRVSAIGINPASRSLLFQDYGKDCFDGFEINFDIKFTSAYSATSSPYTDEGFMCLFSLANIHDDFMSFYGNTQDNLCVGFRANWYSPPGSPSTIKIVICKESTTGSAYTASIGTIYYCTVSRTAGNGSVTLKIYSNAARTTLLSTLIETGFPTTKKWRFIYAMRGTDSQGEWDATYFLENLEVISYN